MSSYPLDSLLRVREYRVKEAQRRVKVRKEALSFAIKAEGKKEEELNKYKIYKREDTERRYKSIMGKILSQEELDTFRRDLAGLSLKEQTLEEELIDLKKETIKAKDALKLDIEELMVYVKAKEKLIYHKENCLKAEKIKKAENEDKEQEEFKTVPSGE